MGYTVKIGLSNKHVHLSQEHLEILFGKGHELTPTKDLVQPGQFASEEKVDIVGPKKTLTGVRVLGPVRPETQVEVSLTEARQLGIAALVRESGDLEGTNGCTLVGPAGEVVIEKGVIAAKRHVHMTPEDAEHFGCENGQIVCVQVEGNNGRALTFGDVVVRVSPKYKLAMHIDTDESNASGAPSEGIIIK